MFCLKLIRPRIIQFSFIEVVLKSKSVSNFWRCNLLTANGAFNFCTVQELKCPTHAELILESYVDSEIIPWEKIKNDILKESDRPKTQSEINWTIIHACRNLKKFKIPFLVSYIKFLDSENIKLTLMELYEIITMFSVESDEVILSNKDILIEIFDNVKENMKLHHLLFGKCAKVFKSIEKCWIQMLSMVDESSHRSNIAIMHLAFGALYHNKVQEAWKLISINEHYFNKQFVDIYMNYCLKMAKDKKFTPSLFKSLVQFCQENVAIIPSVNLMDQINDIVNVLNSNKSTSFLWSVNHSEVNDEGLCSCCMHNIGNVKVSQKEFNLLKSHFLKDVIISKNIHIKTSQAELNKFFKFLNKSAKYNVVVDGLNLHHLANSKNKVMKFLHYFKVRSMNVLLIVRRHFRYNQNFDFFKERCQIFFTDNLSDDDVFTIYATLYGGKDTYFVTRDLLRCHTSLIENPELKKVFLKWQLSHQYTIDPISLKIIPPKVHSCVSQFAMYNTKKSNHYLWHFSTKGTNNKRLSSTDFLSWICLKAEIK